MKDTVEPDKIVSLNRPLHLVEDQVSLAAACNALEGKRRIAVDTESNSFFAYREKVCVLQLSTEDEDWIVDTVKLGGIGPLAGLLEDGAVLKLLHGADYDVVSMKRDFGVVIKPLFDTVTACRLLGLERYGLADLVKSFVGVELSKKLQRIDWSKRPLKAEQLEYLRNDTRFLFQVVDRLQEMLEQADLMEEAEIEFKRLQEREWGRKPFDPNGWNKIKGVERLGRKSRAVLGELYRLREELAQEFDFPPLKLLPDRVLLKLARKIPGDGAALARIRGIPVFLRKRASSEFLDAIQAGLARAKKGGGSADEVRKARNRKETGPCLDGRVRREAVELVARLKEWRKEASRRTGRTTLAVLPNPVLSELARNPPTTMDELARFPGLGKSRFKRFGPEIFDILVSNGGTGET